MTFEQKLKSKIEREATEHNKALAYFGNASVNAVYKNGANLLAPLLVEAYEALKYKPDHDDDCFDKDEPLKENEMCECGYSVIKETLKRLEQFTEE